MATIMNIPQEVFNIILGYNDISVEDIINFRCVCKQFRWIAKYDKYMEKKFSQRWSSAKKVYDKEYKKNVQEESKGNEQKDKKGLNFIETGINCARQVRNYISLILHYNWENDWVIDNLTMFIDILHFDYDFYNNITYTACFGFDEDDYNYFKNLLEHSFFIDEFKNLLTQPLLTGCDLTEKYYIIKLYHFIRQCLVKEKFNILMKQSYKYMVWERVFTMVAQFVQPEKDVFYSNIEASLDNIASEILKCLKEKHPDHSIFSISGEIRSYWKKNNIYDNYWNETEGTQIMNTLEEYIFSKFHLNKWRLSSDTKLEYMCIDSVLKNKFGQELMFLIIYHCVARRLGLRCDVKRIDSDFFIIWNSKYPMYSLRNARCLNLRTNIFLPDYPSVMERLSLYSKAGDFEQLLIGLDCLESILYKFEFMFEDSDECENSNILSFNVGEREFHTRSEDIKFAVGMIVTHQPTECAGVIVGWHQHFDDHNITFSSDNVTCTLNHIHIYEMPLLHCSNYNFIKKQTNYIILTENNKMCYVEEDAITLTIPRWINNSEIGRYFYKFEGTHYVSNKRLARLYPQDAAITATLQQH